MQGVWWTGVIASVEKRFFTQDPARSFECANELIRKHGKPVEVRIEGNHNLQVCFKDGLRYVLGGFTVDRREPALNTQSAFSMPPVSACRLTKLQR